MAAGLQLQAQVGRPYVEIRESDGSRVLVYQDGPELEAFEVQAMAEAGQRPVAVYSAPLRRAGGALAGSGMCLASSVALPYLVSRMAPAPDPEAMARRSRWAGGLQLGLAGAGAALAIYGGLQLGKVSLAVDGSGMGISVPVD